MLWIWAGALAFMTVVMVAAWFVQRAKRNGGWTDVFWTYGVGLTGVGCALAPTGGTLEITVRQALVAAMIAIWSLRLGALITRRVLRGPEDGRYAELRQVASGTFQPVMYFFLQVQAWVAALLGLALFLAAHHPAPGLRAADYAGALLFVLAMIGETAADEALRRFKSVPGRETMVYDRGLWAWTRHPNYVSECLIWLSFAVIAIDLSGAYSQGWFALGAPLIIYLVLTQITGIPALERSLLSSKGAAYRTYQARVPAFFPRPPRKGVAHSLA